MFVARVGSPEEGPPRKDNDPEPTLEQRDGDYRRGAKRLARQLKLAQELLSKEFGMTGGRSYQSWIGKTGYD